MMITKSEALDKISESELFLQMKNIDQARLVLIKLAHRFLCWVSENQNLIQDDKWMQENVYKIGRSWDIYFAIRDADLPDKLTIFDMAKQLKIMKKQIKEIF